MDPEFSVIIPTFNRVKTLGRAIDSVLNQIYHGFELIVIDDGSEDDTPQFIQGFSKVIYDRQQNQGVCAARNRGAEIATKEWLIFLDSDDELSLTALADFVAAIKIAPKKNVFLSGFKKVNSQTGEIEIFPASPKGYSPPLSGTFAIQRDAFFSVGLYDIELSYAENTELFMRLSQNGEAPIVLEAMSLVYYESFSGGSKNLINMEKGLFRILEKHADRMDTIDRWNLNQTLGVIQMRMGKNAMARKSLFKAICCSPKNFKTYVRFLVSCLPIISRRIYKTNLSQV
ncbi:glycosyltransferase family 2 protein [Algoriphagus antarcticus]|uniref:Glycosyl transferase family 2 n=1 Tax=Algoriphagus antarcticus TaxID=238540 RepID=A0A3E0DZU1_9BACT|nr:glycosyltransferase family A protein [Algoriphagus antarcticus]REG91518.1 glycosyl transferase family 2 [Algoriphagus antarcticus]